MGNLIDSMVSNTSKAGDMYYNKKSAQLIRLWRYCTTPHSMISSRGSELHDQLTRRFDNDEMFTLLCRQNQLNMLKFDIESYSLKYRSYSCN